MKAEDKRIIKKSLTKLLKKLDKINKQHYYENTVHNGKKMREVIKNNPVLFEETGLERPARSFLPSLFIAAALPLIGFIQAPSQMYLKENTIM